MIAEKMASDAFDKAGGGGLDLIFTKLEELAAEIKMNKRLMTSGLQLNATMPMKKSKNSTSSF
jgi:hypothetical protein